MPWLHAMAFLPPGCYMVVVYSSAHNACVFVVSCSGFAAPLCYMCRACLPATSTSCQKNFWDGSSDVYVAAPFLFLKGVFCWKHMTAALMVCRCQLLNVEKLSALSDTASHHHAHCSECSVSAVSLSTVPRLIQGVCCFAMP